MDKLFIKFCKALRFAIKHAGLASCTQEPKDQTVVHGSKFVAHFCSAPSGQKDILK